MSKYQRFRDDEKWKQVEPHNKELIVDYELELKSRGKSDKTIKQYINDLKIFACYIYDYCGNKAFFHITKKNIRNFIIYLQDNGTSPARINRLLSSIRTMYDYALEDDDYEEVYEKNPASRIKGLKKEKVREIVFLTSDDVKYLYEYLMSKEEYQQALFLSLLIDSAGRKNEIYQVKKDFVYKDDMFTNKVVGKGGKEFKLMYHKLTKDTYEYYIKQRGNDNEDFLWYKKEANGKVTEISSQTFYTWVNYWNKILQELHGEYLDFNIHSFRHTALELMSTGEHYVCDLVGVEKFGLDILQKLANHNDISTTNSYLKDKTEDELLDAFSLQKNN